jgi:drug/metabolite transporter (DMT)-like permease
VTLVLALVLGTAVLHATWNALAKSVGDRWIAAALIGVVNGIAGLACIVAFGWPAMTAWPYLVASAVLQTVYLLTLTSAYRHGDLSRLYPIMRGTAPVLVTVASVGVLGGRLGAASWAGLIVLVSGIVLLAFGRGVPSFDTGLGLAVLTGVIIAGYTLADGVGVRASENPLGYIGWMFALQGPALLAVCWWRGRPGFAGRLRRHAVRGLLGGVLAVVSYGIVVWAQSRAPLAVVSGLRETSVVWAALIGRLFLGERLVAREIVAVGLACCGAVVLQLAAVS